MTNLPEYEDFCDAYLVRASHLIYSEYPSYRTECITVAIFYVQIPAIAQSAATISDDTIWRPLNYRILLKMRHEEPNGESGKSRMLVNNKNYFSTNLCFENNRSCGGKVRRWLPELIAWVSAVFGWAARRRRWKCWKKNSWNCQISWRCLQGWNFKFFLSENSLFYCFDRNRKSKSSL